MENNDNELDRNEVRAFIFGIIDDMSESEMQQVLKDLEERQKIERRKFDRKDFLRIVDYSVGGQYLKPIMSSPQCHPKNNLMRAVSQADHILIKG